MIFYIKGYEIMLDKCSSMCTGWNWLLSKVWINDKKYFYLSLTIIGFSVTIRKRKIQKVLSQ